MKSAKCIQEVCNCTYFRMAESGEAVLLPGGMRGRLVRQCVIDGGVLCGASH